MIHAGLFEELRERALLLAADNSLPSVAGLIAGQAIRGSWWGHPKSHAIFAALSALARHPDATAIPFISGKVTFVHRRLWPSLLALALARERWQTSGLSAQARTLLKRIEQRGELEASGGAVRELERRLLARTEQIHTDRGSHAKCVQAWERWAERVGVEAHGNVAEARLTIERAVARLVLGRGPRPKLPWDTPQRRAVSRSAPTPNR